MLDFHILCLHAEMSAQEHVIVKEEFNNSESNVQILVMIYITCAINLNLHNMCVNIIMLELTISANIIMQSSSCIYRLEQKHSQRI